jgi:hypothetical protein
MLPIIFAGAAAGAAATSSIMQGLGGYAQAAQSANDMRAQARAARLRADLVDQQTAARVGQVRREAGQVLGEQRAAIAQSGLGMGGTMQAISDSSSRAAELDAAIARWNGTVEATALRDQARGLRRAARATKFNAGLGLASSLLGAGVSGYGGYKALAPTPLGGSAITNSAIPRAMAIGTGTYNLGL